MEFMDIDWEGLFAGASHIGVEHAPKPEPGGAESREHWDKRAASFASKPKRSSYSEQLIARMALAPGETVFDMGCGNGALAVPLAEDGHSVVAADFSPKMLEALRITAEQNGVAERIQIFQRSWQEPFDDLPACDVAVSSRSFITNDLAGGLLKLESKARRNVFLTTKTGLSAHGDRRVLEAMGRSAEATFNPVEFGCMLNWLLVHGRLPEVSYITYPSKWSWGSRDELTAHYKKSYRPQSAEEEAKLLAYLDEHAVEDKPGTWKMDYERTDCWALIAWEPLR